MHFTRFHRWRPPNPRFLDVGCGVGYLMKLMEYLGLEAHGVEPSAWAARYCREAVGLANVRQGNLSEMGYGDEYFGIVSLTHVLEHLRDPLPTLEEIWRVLAPGGVFIGGVPDGDHARDYLIPDHFWFYNETALRHLLSCVGFRRIVIYKGHDKPHCFRLPFLEFSAIKPPEPPPADESRG